MEFVEGRKGRKPGVKGVSVHIKKQNSDEKDYCFTVRYASTEEVYDFIKKGFINEGKG